MITFLQKILFGTLFLLFPLSAFACALPPDVLHEFKINTEHNPITLEYSLQTWDNLRPKVTEILENNHGKLSDDLEKIIQDRILHHSTLRFDDKEILLEFLTGSVQNSSEIEEWNYLPQTMIHATYATNISLNHDHLTTFTLDFDKTLFNDLSPLIHPFLITDIQQNSIPQGYLLDENNKFFDWYSGDFVVKTDVIENHDINYFSLIFGKKTDKFVNPNHKDTSKNSENSEKKSSGNIDIFKPLDTLKDFFQKNNSLWIQIFGILVAIISGMAHGLLPWHSKSLLLAYVSTNGNLSKKNIFTIIASVTLSHTAFIFLLAMIIIYLQKGTGASTLFVQHFGAILYAIFGAFFVFLGIQSLKKLEKNSMLQHKTHSLNCLCCQPKSMKSTISLGFLAGFNPCVDALVLFIFALSIGNAIFALIAILAFSLGIGLTLGIIAHTLARGKNFLHKKWARFAEKFSTILTIITWLFLIIMGIIHFL